MESLLKCTDKNGMHEYLVVMMELEDRARDCLLTLLTLRGEAFIQMMLLDACFVTEFLRKCYLPELRDEDDPIFRTSWIKISNLL